MTTATIRERLYDIIRVADDKKIEALYTLLEDQIAPSVDWSDDEEFVAEMDERYRRWEEGIDKGLTIEEVKASLAQVKKDRLNRI
jgi:hypothetical protein